MEQAVNTFNKGLQMDTHPIVLGNDALSDALNATFVTMNGNEVILLNDMGNRRVDNAFLPPGYLPVGIKEYGGIIYVASYNPITNKSLIGSFPSPEKKISDVDNPNLHNTFDFYKFFKENNVYLDSYLKLNVIKNDSFLIPLTGDISLRAGDKFAIYSSGSLDTQSLTSIWELITNYNNVNGSSDDLYKAITPKNRKYTLLIGILNSQNEFVDITKTLCRWELNESDGPYTPINFSSEASDIFKFNKGYFIPGNFTSPVFSNSLKDSQLIKERLKITANTYAYKLIGPMYLKIIFNHIENFNYNIYGIKNEGTTKIWIEGYIRYNCLDNGGPIFSDSNEYYDIIGVENVGWNHPETDFPVFDLYDTSESEVSLRSPIEGGDLVKISKCSYDPNNNLYSLKITKEYTINLTTGNYNYIIGVLADSANANIENSQVGDIYLKGLSVKGLLNLDLLGTGVVKINGWRFYNNLEKGSTSLTVSFDAYPIYDTHFGGLYFKFIPIRDDNAEEVRYPEEGVLPVYNGRLTFSIAWNNRFKPRTLYAVETYYSIYDDKTNEYYNNQKDIKIEENFVRWFLTTELFNEFYQPISGIEDFSTTNEDDFINKMTIDLGSSNIVSNDSIKSLDEFDGGLISKTKDIYYTCKHNYNVNINSTSEIKIINEELYPNFIFVNENMKNKISISGYGIHKIDDEIFNYNDSYKNIFVKHLSINKGNAVDSNLSDSDLESKFSDLEMININLINENSSLTGNITYWDNYLGYNASGVSNIKNVFGSMFDNLFKTGNFEEISPKDSSGNISGTFGGVVVNYDSDSSDDGHFIDVYTRLSNALTLSSLPGDDYLLSGGKRVKERFKNGLVDFEFEEIKDDVYQCFNSGTNPGQIFMYLYAPSRNYFTNNTSMGSGQSGSGKARVWWKTSDPSKWALFPILYEGNGFQNYIKNQFIYDRIYCLYDEYPGTIENLHATDDNRIFNNFYKIPITLNITYSIEQGIHAVDIVSGVSGTDLNLNNGIIVGSNNLPSNLNFKINPVMPNVDPAIVIFNLESSEEFLNNITKFNTNSIEGVDIVTGLMFDTDGNRLNRNYMYKYNLSYELDQIPRNTNWAPDTITNINRENNTITWKVVKHEYTPDNTIYSSPTTYFLHEGRYIEERYIKYVTFTLLTLSSSPYGWNGPTPPNTDANTYFLLIGGECVPKSNISNNTVSVPSSTIYHNLPGKRSSLSKINNNYIKVDFDNKVNGINNIVYNREDTVGFPDDRYLTAFKNGHSNTFTTLDFALINIVKLS